MYSDQVYSCSFDVWFKNTLRYLGAVPVESGRAHMAALDQRWWDSNERLPAKYIILKRNYDVGNIQYPPLTLADARRSAPSPELLACAEKGLPVVLEVVDEMHGLKMSDLATVRLTIDEKYAAEFTFPDETMHASRVVIQADFPRVAELARRHDERELAERRAGRTR